MKIETAIEILFQMVSLTYEGSDLDLDKAIKLGIKALKRWKAEKENKRNG